MRDAHTRVWEASTSFHVQPRIMEKGTDINYRTPEGAWEKTDTTLRESREPGAVLEAVRQRAKLHFSAIGEETFNVSYTIDGQAIRTGVRALALLVPETGQRQILWVAQVSRPVADGDRAVYANVFPGCDVVYENRNVTFKQNLILREDFTLPNAATYGINPASAMLVVITEIDVSQTDRAIVAKTREGAVDMRQAALADASRLDFRNEQGETICRFKTGMAWSGYRAATPFRYEQDVHATPVWKRFEWTAGRLYLLEGLRYTALPEIPRPIVIDYDSEARSGTQTKNEVWDRDKTWWISAPYTLENCELVIEPGTVVKLGTGANANNDERIVIGGGAKVAAVGEPYLPVFFTAYSDEGYGVDTDSSWEGTPTRGGGNYQAVFDFDTEGESENQSSIQYCRFRWAGSAIVVQRTALDADTAIRDCIFNECDAGVRMVNWSDNDVPPNEPSEGVEPAVTLTNNLMYGCNAGVALTFVNSNSQQGFTLGMYHNTFADFDSGTAVLVDSDYGLIVNVAGRNNIVANCDYAYADPDDKVDGAFSYADVDVTGYAEMGHASVTSGGWSTITSGSLGSNDPNYPDYLSTSPFDSNDANGSYYLNQTMNGKRVDIVDETLPTYLEGKTTKAPTAKNCATTYSTPETWSEAAEDTSYVDLGYHHPRVDFIVGTGADEEDYTTEYSADLTVNQGVVVAFFRPDFAVDEEVFSYLQFNSGAKIKCNLIANGPTERYGPTTEYQLVRFDASYYLGTNFVANRWQGAAGDGTDVGPFTEAGGIVLKGNNSGLKATLFRHLHKGLSFEGCEMEYNDYYQQLVGLTFERGDVGIAAEDIAYTAEERVLLGNLHTMFDAFINMSAHAIWIKSTAEADDAFIVTAHNHTFLNCGTAVYMDCVEPGQVNSYPYPYYTQTWSGANCVVNCGAGFTGESGASHVQYQMVTPFIDGKDGGNGFETDAYWNNDKDIDHSRVKTWDFYGAVPTQTPITPQRVNPLLVSLPSAAEARDWHGIYLAQNEHDASLIPFRLGEVDADDPFDNLQSWPSGEYRVVVYGVDSIGGWTQGSYPKATQDIINGAWDTQIGPTVYNNNPSGDLLVEIWRLDDNGGSGSDGCALDIRLMNESLLTIWFDKSVIASMGDDERVLVWIGLDGSSFYATEAHDSVFAYALKHNARYAMWHVSGARMMSAYDGRPGSATDKRSPVIDVTTGPPGVASNGTTSTAISYLLDHNQENGLFRLDAGFPHWGWNYRFPAEIRVTYGEGEAEEEIPDGWDVIDTGIGTDFGFAEEGQNNGEQHTFVIHNDHQSNYLNVGRMILPAGFILVDDPPQAIAPQSSGTFKIQLDDEGTGTKSGFVEFPNNDPDKDPFDFKIQGEVTSQP